MKILHVLEHSIPYVIGYSIRAKYIVENQKKFGICPVVVTSPLYQNGKLEEEINGIKYYRTSDIKRPDKSGNKLKSYWDRYRMVQNYKKAVLKISEIEKPDIIHAHSSYLNGYAANYAGRRLGIPSIYELRTLWGEAAVIEDGLISGSIKHRIIRSLEYGVMKKANHLVAISDGIKKEIIRDGILAEKIDILPNGVDSSIFTPIKKNKDLMEKLGLNGSFVIGYIGSIRKLEGLSYLIEAFPVIKKYKKNVKLLIVGSGADKKNIEDKARQLNIEDIIFTGNVPHEEISQYYSVIDLFVFPRIDAKINHAVTPLKPLEVMSTGKVCLCSDVGGLAELVKNNYNGLTFRNQDKNDLADKVIAIAEDKEKYKILAANSINWIKKERDWNVLIPKYKKIYEKVMKG